jgi:hypothetical protein
MACDNMADIGKKLGVTRAAVSQTLKRALRKVYIKIKAWNKYSPTQTLLSMSGILGCDERELFCLFPRDVQNDIKKYAIKRRSEHKTLS